MATHKLSILVEALGTGDVNRKLKGVDRTLNSIGVRAHKGITTAAGNLVRLGEAAAVGVAGGLAYAVKQAGDFQASLLTIGTIVDKAQLPKVGQDIRGIARETGIGVDELSAAYYDLVSAGVKATDATSVLTNATHLAIGGLATTTETVDLLTTAMNAYGLTTQGVTKATDMFAQAVADGKVKASEIAATFADVAPLAKVAGVGIDQIAASYAYLTAQGVPAAEVATEMNRALTSIVNPSKELAKAGKDLGINWEREVRKKGLIPTLQEIRTYAEKNHIPLQKLMGRIEGVKYVLQTTGPAEKGFLSELDKIRKSAGEATAQFEERQQGLNFQLGRLKALAVDAAITIGSTLLPKITPLVEKLNAFISGHQGDIAKFGDQLAGAFDKIAAYAERVPWGAIGEGLKTAGFWAGKLFDVFASLPPNVQGTIVALAGLNKLSGGAVSGIVGELGKGLIKGVLGMNAGVVNIKAAVVNGGGGIPGAGAIESAAGAGIASTVAAAASALAAGAGLALLMAAVGEWVLANSNDPTGSKGRTTTATARNLPAATVNPTKGFGQIDPLAEWVKAHGGTLNGPLAVDVVKPVTVADPHTERQIDQLRATQAAAASAARKSDATVDSTMHGVHQAILGTESRRAAQQATANARLGEIARKRWSTRINVMTRITDRISVSISSRSIAHQGYINKVTQSGSASKYLL